MTKAKAVSALQAALQQKRDDAQQAYDKANSSATSGELKQEGKYDTRAIEESYLAQGLANSLAECEQALYELEELSASSLSDTVGLGSLIQCRREGRTFYFLLSKSGGGTEVEIDGQDLTIITPKSPIGNLLLGQRKGYTSPTGVKVVDLL